MDQPAKPARPPRPRVSIPVVAQFAHIPKQNERTNGYTVHPDAIGGHRYIYLIFLLPALVVFDILVYLANRNACLNCGDVSEFVKNSSLTAYIISACANFVRAHWRSQ